ncbi:ZIP family metal transporter [Salinimicrobium tongyeongense]|uniref:ZIP family metal transporter n=1 Tax=Salinimicrobium tongyeongense TaxID=2809707 RepID=A0ABY6NQ06_9FLAO|nr:ZIP family metal transporter [Salinimicrobium tongyeongense]UZH54977.1 ZIP family metal transporter [Salinimicrobium tongyeongense]
MLYMLPLLAVVIGYVISLFLKPSSSTGFQLLLSFSGAFLLSVTVFEMLPEVYESGFDKVGLFIMAGLLLQIFLEFLSKGVEHGHMHHGENSVKFPYLLLLSLSLHALLEGFPLNQSSDLLHGVVIHKIPVAAILAAFLFHSKIAKFKAFLFLAIFGLMTPLGSWIHANFMLSEEYSAYINAVVIGIFLHVSTTILFEASKNHSFNATKLAVVISGILLAYFL